MYTQPKQEGWRCSVIPGKKITVQLDEILHEEIEDLQVKGIKETGEKPSKEEVIAAGLFELSKEKKEKRGRRSEFDELFSL